MVSRLSVRTRLLATFAGAALFAVLASVTGLMSFRAVEQAQRAILSDHVPTQSLALALAQSAQSLAAAAPLMIIAATDSERASAVERIQGRIDRLETLLADLEPRVNDPRFLQQLGQQKDELVKALRALDYRVAERIQTGARIAAALDQGRARLAALEAAVIDLHTPHDSPAFSPDANEAVHAMLVEIQRAHTALERIPSAGAARLDAVRAAYDEALERTRGHLFTLDNRPLRHRALALVAQAEALTRSGPDDPFTQRGRQDLAERRSDALLEAYTQQAFRMVYSASSLANDITAAMTGAGLALESRLAATAGILWAIAGLSIFAALTLAITVDRTISDRLALLRRSMADHAAGSKDPIPDLGADEIGDMARAMRVFVDTIAERETALTASEAHLRAVIDAVPETILTVDRTGRILTASRAADGLFGYPRSLVGLPIHRLFAADPGGADQSAPPAPPPDQPLDSLSPSVCLSLLATEEHRTTPLPILCRRADATGFPADVTVDRITQSGPDHWFLVLTLRDTSERARQEAERQRFLALLSAAQEATDDGLMVVDNTGDIITCNRKFFFLYGQDPSVTVTLPRSERLPRVAAATTDPEAFMRRIAALDADPTLIASDRITLADGRLLERYSAPFRIGDRTAGRLWSLRDITEQHRAQQDLTRAKEEAETALRDLKSTQNHLVEVEKMASLGQLVAGIAHEINTPVGITVTGASHIADETTRIGRALADGRLTRSQFEEALSDLRDSARLVLSNAQRAAELIQSFKQVAVDQTSDERRRFELGPYIREVLVSLGPNLRKYPHVIETNVAQPIDMDSYPGALSQVIANLVLNAVIHAFPDGQPGSVCLATRQIATDTVELTITDTGVGMPDAVRRRIFEPFFTTRRGQGGSGLGLNIVFNLVTRTLGGRIDVGSAPGQGTTFTLILPRVPPRRRAIIFPSGPPPA